jgi:2',3'-cyclic-nucleotide 2'-phosphodiesterase (5'-nucleotidase family)
VPVVQALAKQAKFPVLSANLVDETTHQRPEWARPSVHLHAGELDVCVIGLLTSGLKHMTTKKGSAGVDVEREEEVVERELAANKTSQVTLLLTHCGVGDDERLARKFKGRLTAIVGGHSHTPIFEPKRVDGDGPFVVQAGSRGQWLGRAELVVARDSGKLIDAKGKLIEIDPKVEGEADDVKKALDEGSREVSKVMDVKVGELVKPLVRAGSRETSSSPLGNILCDMMREHAKADLAFHNKTGIRADMDFTGEVKLRHLHQVSPFGNTVVCVTLTGDQVRELIEHTLGRGRPMLEVSGGVIRYDSSKNRGERLVDVTIGGKPLDAKASYRVATNSFLAEGGDGLKVFTQGTDRQDDGTTMLEISRRWFEGKTIDPGEVEHRFVDVSKEAPKDE